MNFVFTQVIFVKYLNFLDDLKHVRMTNMQKTEKSGRGQFNKKARFLFFSNI